MSGRQSAAVDRALELVDKGLTRYAAARKCGLSLSTVYRADKRRQRAPLGAQKKPEPLGALTDPQSHSGPTVEP